MRQSRQRDRYPLQVSNLGIMTVSEAEELMSRLSRLRLMELIPNTLLFLSHPKTISLGEREKPDQTNPNILVSLDRLTNEGISVVKSSRGGLTTYHWPGQIICYPIFKLTNFSNKIGDFVYNLEEIVQRVLLKYQVLAERNSVTVAHHGLWFNKRKILSLGLRISHWVTSFGFALNYQGPYSPISYIKPCGIENLNFISLDELITLLPSQENLISEITTEFCNIFNLEHLYSAQEKEIFDQADLFSLNNINRELKQYVNL